MCLVVKTRLCREKVVICSELLGSNAWTARPGSDYNSDWHFLVFTRTRQCSGPGPTPTCPTWTFLNLHRVNDEYEMQTYTQDSDFTVPVTVAQFLQRLTRLHRSRTLPGCCGVCMPGQPGSLPGLCQQQASRALAVPGPRPSSRTCPA